MLRVLNPFINIQIGCDFYMFEHSDRKIMHGADHGGSLMIECIDIWELTFNDVLLRCC